jgi:hypothetical protein
MKLSLSFIILAVFFLFSSFAFGCMENWSIATAEVILFLGAGLSGYMNKDFYQWPRKLSLFAILIVILIGICIIQLIPFPVSFWRAVDNRRIQMYEYGIKSEELLQSDKYRIDPFEKSEAAYESERRTPKVPSYLTISRAPISTLRALIVLLSFFCFILLLENIAKEGINKLRNLGFVVGLIGLAVGLMALVEKGMESRTHVMWLRESSRALFAFGPFVNGNHGEAFINLTFPILCYLLWRKSKNARKISDKIGMRLIIVAFLMLQTALVVSGSSRGNFLTLAIMPAIFLFHLGLSKKNRYAFAGAFVVLGVVAIAILFLFQSGLLTDEVRITMNTNILSTVNITGYGLGSYEEVFPAIVKDWPLFKPMRNVFLENEYLQAYFEIGIAAFLLSSVMIIFIASASYKALTKQGSRFWLISPLISELARAWVDMNFHVIPLAATYLLIYAIVVDSKY